MSEITGAILAGGLGTRLRTVVSDRPKVLARVGGKPFLAYLLDQLVAVGLMRVVLLTGYRSEQIQEEFGDEYRSMRLEYSIEHNPLGTGGALRFALPKFSSARVLLLNGDSYCAADLLQLRAFHQQHSADASLTLARVSDTTRFGKVELAAENRVVRFLEKHEAGGTGWINAGIYLLDTELIGSIPSGRAVSLEREMFPEWLQHRRLRGFVSSSDFLDIGTPESYRLAEDFFARQQRVPVCTER